MRLESEFKSPQSEYRGVPFWSWNDELKVEELRRQIKEMDEKGLGGFFMHSRIGLITPYLSKKWMECIKACVKEAKKRGMSAWLYDEDRWPSGFAGGKVPKMGEKYRQKFLVCREEKLGDALLTADGSLLKEENKPLLIHKVEGTEDRGQKKDVRAQKEIKRAIKNPFLYFYALSAPLGEEWYNGYCYPDLLNGKVVDAFIKTTYSAYYKEVGKDFGGAVPGIFTDEPNYLQAHRYRYLGPIIPWTTDLPKYFKEKNGYDLVEHLPSLFYEIGDFTKYRYDFWATVTLLFAESYSKRLYDWCDKHNLLYTGHYLAEDSLRSQIEVIGSAMVHYEYMHVPGIDHLGRNINDLITPKQCSSVAHQLGKKRVLSETYGCSGWNLSFEGMKWIGDWEYVLGVNLLNPHLCLYSAKGCRKRDHPPSLYYHQPWWKEHKLIGDYFARLSFILSQGEFKADILVIHPLGSAWATYSPLDTKVVDKLNKSLVELSRTLSELKRDFDFGEELIMERYAKVEGDRLKVGKMSYKVVLLPPLIVLRESTFNLLRQFISQGGKVIALRASSGLVSKAKLKTSLGNITVVENLAEMKIKLERFLPPQIKVEDKRGGNISSIYCQERKISGKNFYFLVNTDPKVKYETKVKIPRLGRVRGWNLRDGVTEDLPSEIKGKKTILNLTFERGGSFLIEVDEKEKGKKIVFKRERLIKEIPLRGVWEVKTKDLNALTLDYCQYRVGKSRWEERVPVFKVQEICESKGKEVRVELKFTFKVRCEPKMLGRAFLVLEKPENYQIKVNNKRVLYKDEGSFHDLAFRKIKISEFLKKGENNIILSCLFKPPKKEGTLIFLKEGVELESLYLIGDFRVKKERGEFVIVKKEGKAQSGDLVEQGYPFFAGSLSLIQKLRLGEEGGGKVYPVFSNGIYLNLKGLEAIVAGIKVNQREAGKIILPPHRLEITNLIRKGENIIEIELTNSLRNLLGPHHHKEGELFGVGPGSFCDEDNWTDEYNFVKFGIRGASIEIKNKK